MPSQTNSHLKWMLNFLLQAKSKIDFAVGGQAVIEGVMMRSPNFIAITVRKENGELVDKSYPFQNLVQRYKWLNIPLLRGVINMFEMMVVGTKALNWSADQFIEDEGEEESSDKKTGPKEPQKESKFKPFLMGLWFALNLIVSLALAIFIFKFIPLRLTELINNYYPALAEHSWAYNLTDGVIKLLIFVVYIWVISFAKTIHRVFEYHGAEHKSIYTYENDLELVPEQAAKQSRFHPRCGTSFIIFIFVLSIVVYMFIPRDPNFAMNLLKRLSVLPLIAGLSYEVLKLSAKHTSKLWVRAFIKPGLIFQRLTTKEPDSKQLEVALNSLKLTLELEKDLETTK